MSLLRPRFRGALLGVVVGDALGAPFEGTPPATAGRQDLLAEALAAGPGPPRAVVRYTDDTVMTAALARCLVEHGSVDPAAVAAAFDDAYRAEPERGWGRTLPAVLDLVGRGVDRARAPQLVFDGQGSEGDGAAMRVAPIGLVAFPDLDRVVELAGASARVTHTHPLAVDGAVIQALAVALVMRSASGQLEPAAFLAELTGRTSTEELRRRLAAVGELVEVADPVVVAERLGAGFEAVEAVPAAVWAFLSRRGSFADAVTVAVRLGGDTDTVAAMTGALAGAHLGEDAIPPSWREQVEGVDRMRQLADDLVGLVETRCG